MSEPCSTKFYPIDVERMSEGSKLREHLAAGREVVLGPNGWIIDSWDPVTKKVYDADGNEIGTRDKTFMLPDTSEHRIQGAEVILPERIDEFTEGGDVWSALNAGFQVTLGPKGRWIDAWDPATKTVRNIFGEEIGSRDTPYVEYRKKEVKAPLTYTNTPDDILMYDPEYWVRGFLEEGYHVTIDSHGNVLDIWDPVTGNLYNDNMEIIGTRTDPYPSDSNISDVKDEIRVLTNRIRVLQQRLYKERGSVKYVTNTKMMILLRERGRKLWLWGRLQNRKRRMDVAYQKRRTKSK